MKTKNAVIAASIVTTGLLAIGLFGANLSTRQSPATEDLSIKELDKATRDKEAELALAQAETLKDADNAIAAAKKLTTETVKTATPSPGNKDSLPWKVGLAEGDERPSHSLNAKVKEFSAVRVDPHPDHLPSEGEQIVLPMLDGKSVRVNVESTENNSNGDYIWSGHLDGYNNDYPIVMTYGENSTFATITTPQGSYSLEALKGVGWLYKNPSEAELTTEGKNDFIIPPDEH